MMFHRALRHALVLAVFGLPAAADAQAFGLNEIGSCALARGFAVTGAPCDDASSIYWNPGAVQKKTGLSLLAGAAVIKLDGDFTADSTYRVHDADIPTAVVPHVFLTYLMQNRKVALGLGLYVPYGLTSQWKDDFPGRFSAKKASLQTIYVQPNVAFQITDNWSFGGGPVIGHSTVELIRAADLSSFPVPSAAVPPGTTFGNFGIPRRTEFVRASLKGSAIAYGFNLGLHGKLTPDIQVGIRGLSQLSFNYDDADATFTQTPTGLVFAAGNPLNLPGGTPVDAIVATQFAAGGPLTPQKVKTQIRHPSQLQVGLGYTGIENTTLSIDYAYTGWKAFNQLPVSFQGPAAASASSILVEDYKNTSSLRLGAEQRMTNGSAVRLGFTAATSAAPPETVTPLLPEMNRQLAMIGGFLPITTALGLDATYSHIFTPGSRGRIDERAPTADARAALALNSGAYTLSANILSLSLKYAF